MSEATVKTATPKADKRATAAKLDDNGKLAAAIESVVEQPKETKSDKFRRLAVNRVPRVVKLLAMLKNLANKNVYDYTDEQRDKVLAVVGESYRQFKAAFEQLPQKETGFTL